MTHPDMLPNLVQLRALVRDGADSAPEAMRTAGLSMPEQSRVYAYAHAVLGIRAGEFSMMLNSDAARGWMVETLTIAIDGLALESGQAHQCAVCGVVSEDFVEMGAGPVCEPCAIEGCS